MAKNSVRDYSSTNSLNTDIQSIDISEGCSPAGINNAIREVMADLKDVSTGAVALESPSADSLTVTGDLTVDTSTLYVDSTNNRVGVGTSSPSRKLEISGAGTEMSMVDTNQSTDRKTMNWFMSSDKAHWRIMNDAQTAGGGQVNLDWDGNLVASNYVHGGAGTVVQTRVTYIQQLNSLNTTTFQEFSTAFRLSITPKYSNSIMVVEYATALNPDGAANLLMLIKPIKIISGTSSDLSVIGSANGSSNRMGGGGGFRSNNGYDANDQNIITFMGYDVPSTTSTMQYGFEYKCEGSQTTRINHSSSSGSSFGYTIPTIIRATEIKV